jgi:predicted anti-sigma-YlaC factor YlaD
MQVTQELGRMAGGLRCAEVLDRLASYLEASLEEEERANVEAHLRECENCSAFGGAYAGVVHELHLLLQPEEPQAGEGVRRLQHRLMERLQD